VVDDEIKGVAALGLERDELLFAAVGRRDVVTSSTSVRLPFGVSAAVLSPAFSSELAVIAGLGEELGLAVSPLKA